MRLRRQRRQQQSEEQLSPTERQERNMLRHEFGLDNIPLVPMSARQLRKLRKTQLIHPSDGPTGLPHIGPGGPVTRD